MPDREQQDSTRIEWLRAATKEASDSIDRGEGFEFETIDDLAAYVRQVCEEISVDRRRP